MAIENQVTFAEVGNPKRVTQLTENTDASGAYFLTEKAGESAAKKTSYATVESAVKSKVQSEYLQTLSVTPASDKTMSEKLVVGELKKRDDKIVQLEQDVADNSLDVVGFISKTILASHYIRSCEYLNGGNPAAITVDNTGGWKRIADIDVANVDMIEFVDFDNKPITGCRLTLIDARGGWVQSIYNGGKVSTIGYTKANLNVGSQIDVQHAQVIKINMLHKTYENNAPIFKTYKDARPTLTVGSTCVIGEEGSSPDYITVEMPVDGACFVILKDTNKSNFYASRVIMKGTDGKVKYSQVGAYGQIGKDITTIYLTLFYGEGTPPQDYVKVDINTLPSWSYSRFTLENTYYRLSDLENKTIFNPKCTLFMSCASFGEPVFNTWFEQAGKTLGVTTINRGIGGQAIADTANLMASNTLFYSDEEFDNADILVLYQVHDKDVFNSPNLKDTWQEYLTPFDRSDYAAAFDYVIKKYIYDCLNRKNVTSSKWYGTPHGKPCRIVLCTHWHDARIVYNTSVRKLAEKWNLTLCKFDEGMNFTYRQPFSDGTQPSTIWAYDGEANEGRWVGLHPLKGWETPIQKLKASIFCDAVKKLV